MFSRLAKVHEAHLAELVRAGAGVAQFLALARGLDIASYGRLASLTFITALLVPLLTMPASMVMLRRSARGESSSVMTRSVLWTAMKAMTAGAAVISVLFLFDLLPFSYAICMVFVLAELGPGTALQGLTSMAQGRQHYGTYLALVAASSGVRLLAALLLVFMGLSVLQWTAILMLTSCAVAAMALLVVTIGEPANTFKRNADDPNDTWVYAANSLVVRFVDDIDKVLLGSLSSYAEAGAYTAGYRLASYVLVPTRGVLGRFLPSLFAPGGTSQDQMLSNLRAIRRRLVITSLPVAGVLSMTALALPVVLGPEYLASQGLALALIPCLALRGHHYVYGDLLAALGRARIRLFGQLISAALPLLAYLLLIPALGSWGAVIATLLGELATISLMRRLAESALSTCRTEFGAP